MQWMSLSQFGAIVGKDVQTVRKWARLGKIDTIVVGGVNKVTFTELERYRTEGHLTEDSNPPIAEEITYYLEPGEDDGG